MALRGHLGAIIKAAGFPGTPWVREINCQIVIIYKKTRGIFVGPQYPG